MRGLRSLIEIVRIPSCLAGVVGCVAATRLVDGCGLPDGQAVLAAISVACAIVFAQATNDIVDMDLDRHDKPTRPLPSGRVSLAAAWRVAGASAIAGLALAFLLQHALAIFMCAVLASSWLYSRYWKSTVLLGNFVVAAITSSTVIYGILAVKGTITLHVALLQTFVFLVALTLEVVKTARDALGDEVAGATTFATRYGVRPSAMLAAGLCALIVPVAFAPTFQARHRLAYAIVVGVGIATPALAAATSLARAHRVLDLIMPLRLVGAMWGFMVVSLLLA